MSARDDLIRDLAVAVGQEKARQIVANIEVTVGAEATKVVKKGIIISGLIGLTSVILAAKLSKG